MKMSRWKEWQIHDNQEVACPVVKIEKSSVIDDYVGKSLFLDLADNE